MFFFQSVDQFPSKHLLVLLRIKQTNNFKKKIKKKIFISLMIMLQQPLQKASLQGELLLRTPLVLEVTRQWQFACKVIVQLSTTVYFVVTKTHCMCMHIVNIIVTVKSLAQ